MDHNPSNYDQITENIWIGNNMCCMVHNSELTKLGFDADIDLEEDRAEQPPNIKVYLWLPTVDHTPSSLAQLSTGVAALDSLTKANQKVYVHCMNGHGRSPSLVAAYLISQGYSAIDAFNYIKSKRPVIHLDDSQFQALEQYSKNINKIL